MSSFLLPFLPSRAQVFLDSCLATGSGLAYLDWDSLFLLQLQASLPRSFFLFYIFNRLSNKVIVHYSSFFCRLVLLFMWENTKSCCAVLATTGRRRKIMRKKSEKHLMWKPQRPVERRKPEEAADQVNEAVGVKVSDSNSQVEVHMMCKTTNYICFTLITLLIICATRTHSTETKNAKLLYSQQEIGEY